MRQLDRKASDSPPFIRPGVHAEAQFPWMNTVPAKSWGFLSLPTLQVRHLGAGIGILQIRTLP
jgi:hypothetical protein